MRHCHRSKGFTANSRCHLPSTTLNERRTSQGSVSGFDVDVTQKLHLVLALAWPWHPHRAVTRRTPFTFCAHEPLLSWIVLPAYMQNVLPTV